MLEFLKSLIIVANLRAYEEEQIAVMYPLEQFFPAKKFDGLSFKMVKGRRNNPIVLRPSSLEDKAKARQRKGVKLDDKECIYFKDKMVVNNEALIALKTYESLPIEDPRVKRAITEIYDDQMTLVEGARATAELLRAELMCNGQIVVNDGGVQKTLDYGILAEQKFTTSKSWSDPTALILDDIQANILLAKERGFIPDVAMLDSKTLGYMRKNNQVQAMIKNTAVSGKVFISDVTISNLLKSNFGITPLLNDRKYMKEDGTLSSYWKENTFTLFSSAALPGKTNYGTTPQELIVGVTGKDVVGFDDDAIFVQTKMLDDPVTKETIVDTNVIPSFEGADAVQIMTVIKP